MDSLQHDEESKVTPIIAALIAGVAIAVIATIDLLVPPHFNPPIAYPLAVAICAWTRARMSVWAAAAVAVILTLVGVAWGPATQYDIPPYTYWTNRVLAIAATLTTAGVVHLWIQTWSVVSRSRADLQEQNEELQSQTEELERQSEELRLANEELTRRERALQSLLDLSRSLTAGLSQDETLDRICSSLSQLVNHEAHAAAILERRGEELHLRCTHGFGEHGPEQPGVPAARSFARLVMERNQAAFLEDASLRPDIVLPQRRNEPPFRSVLAAPLRVRGRAIGTVEVYSDERQSWSEEHIALVESLAAQASISLESADLFEEIDQQRRRFETVFRTLPIGVMVADADQTDIRINPAGAALFTVATDANFAAPNFVRTWRVYRNGQPVPLEQYPVRKAIAGELVQNEELEIVFNSGRRLMLLTSANPIRDRDGRTIGAVCAFTDVSAMNELQREIDARRREAEEASVRKTRFLAAVSHDIRTPANAINLMAALVRRTAEDPALVGQVPKLAAELQGSAATLIELVSDVLDVARFDTGKIELQESVFPLGGLLAEEGRQLMPLAQEKKLRFVVHTPEPEVTLRSDRIKLGRVIANLVSNAIKFTNEGQVHLSARVHDGSVSVAVADTGVGIAAEHVPLIFDEFFQLRNPERDRHKGTGLGLAICKRLVDAMGGAITVDSTPGKGTTFTVTLPRSAFVPGTDPKSSTAASGAPGKSPLQEPATLAGLSILLVEDHDSTRSATAQILQDYGARVFQAPDGKTGLDLLRREKPQVLLLDLMLPDMDGRDILKAFGGTRPDHLSRVLVLTGNLISTSEGELKALGADALCPKPIDVRCLIEAIAAPPEKREA